MSRNLGLLLRDDAAAPDRLALVDLPDPEHPREYSYAELQRLADAAAGFVRKRGIERGERVGIQEMPLAGTNKIGRKVPAKRVAGIA